jgi:protein involved in polysaccharide export with SLBB domain
LGTILNAGGPTSFNTEARVLRLPKGSETTGTEAMDTLTPIVVDLQKLFGEGDQSQNVILRDGDVLMVAEKSPGGAPGDKIVMGPNQFYVVGSVMNPGVYNYQANDTVLDAILRAGGFSEFASRNSTKVVRDSEGKTRTFQIKMKDVMEKGDMEKNIKIFPGDMIIVPESFF